MEGDAADNIEAEQTEEVVLTKLLIHFKKPLKQRRELPKILGQRDLNQRRVGERQALLPLHCHYIVLALFAHDLGYT